jgi:hypothetical protein
MVTIVQLDAGKKMQQLHRRQLQLQHSVVVVQVRSAAAVLWHHMHFVFRGTCVLFIIMCRVSISPRPSFFHSRLLLLHSKRARKQRNKPASNHMFLSALLNHDMFFHASLATTLELDSATTVSLFLNRSSVMFVRFRGHATRLVSASGVD